jgi:hypothetical protein
MSLILYVLLLHRQKGICCLGSQLCNDGMDLQCFIVYIILNTNADDTETGSFWKLQIQFILTWLTLRKHFIPFSRKSQDPIYTEYL